MVGWQSQTFICEQQHLSVIILIINAWLQLGRHQGRIKGSTITHFIRLSRTMLQVLAGTTLARTGGCGWYGGGGGWARLLLNIVLRRLRITSDPAAICIL